MNRRNKPTGIRMLITIWAMLLICAVPIPAFAAQDEQAAVAEGVTIKVNGEVVKLSEPVRGLDGRLFIPVALVAGMFDAKISWDKDNEEATIQTAHGDKIVLGNGVPVVYFNEGRYRMDEAPFVAEGRMYIPLRHVAELLHAEVNWHAKELTAELIMVKPAVVAENYGLAQISEEYGSSKTELLKRNGLDSADGIVEGTELRVVVPSILANKAEPFTEKDLQLLARITEVESGHESYEGQLGVANVILNRVKNSKFPDTVREVIYSGKQFPPAHNGQLDKAKSDAISLRAAKDALNGKNNVEDAVYFFNPAISKGSFWSGLTVITTIGHHSFAK